MENNEKTVDDEIIDQLVKRVTEMEKKTDRIPDYTPHFGAQLELLEAFLESSQKANADLHELVMQQFAANPLASLRQSGDEAHAILIEIKKLLPIGYRHHFDLKKTCWIIAGVILLIIAAISTGLCGHLWVSNNRLRTADVKYRMIQQVYPDIGLWADTTYLNNPGLAEKTTAKFEYESAAISRRAKKRNRTSNKKHGKH